jgi:probable rRNA maturation factor
LKLDLVHDEVERPWRPAAEIRRLAEELVAGTGPVDGELQIVLTDDATLLELNREYRKKDCPTDVLSFSYLSDHEGARAALLGGESAKKYADPHSGGEETVLVGQVLISLETVRERPAREGRDFDEEILFLMTHGLLHVLGYDHVDDEQAAEMEERERELFAPILDEYRAIRGGGRP